jgi:hypothetical protein
MPFLDEYVICNIGLSDVNAVAATLHDQVTSRMYIA